MKKLFNNLKVENDSATTDMKYEIIRLKTEMAKINKEVKKMKKTIEMIKTRDWRDSQD